MPLATFLAPRETGRRRARGCGGGAGGARSVFLVGRSGRGCARIVRLPTEVFTAGVAAQPRDQVDDGRQHDRAQHVRQQPVAQRGNPDQNPVRLCGRPI